MLLNRRDYGDMEVKVLRVAQIRSMLNGMKPQSLVYFNEKGELVIVGCEKQTRSKIDLKKAKEMRAQGKTYSEVGEFFGVTKQAAHFFLSQYGV